MSNRSRWCHPYRLSDPLGRFLLANQGGERVEAEVTRDSGPGKMRLGSRAWSPQSRRRGLSTDPVGTLIPVKAPLALHYTGRRQNPRSRWKRLERTVRNVVPPAPLRTLFSPLHSRGEKKWSGIWGGSIGPQKKRGRINGSNCISQHAMHHASYEINSRIIDAVIHSVYPASSKESRPNAMPYARPGWNS